MSIVYGITFGALSSTGTNGPPYGQDEPRVRSNAMPRAFAASAANRTQPKNSGDRYARL